MRASQNTPSVCTTSDNNPAPRFGIRYGVGNVLVRVPFLGHGKRLRSRAHADSRPIGAVCPRRRQACCEINGSWGLSTSHSNRVLAVVNNSSCIIFQPGQSGPVVINGVEVGQIAVAEILPRIAPAAGSNRA